MGCAHGHLNRGNIIMPLTAVMVAFGGAMDALHRQLVGIGFTAQGNFVGMPYKRVCYDKNMDWVFDGIMTICLAILALADMARRV